MRILITGGAGFIGTNTALKAMEQGHEIYAFDNLSRLGVEFNLAELSKQKLFRLIRGDIRLRSDFERIPEVEGIIHLAANPGIPWSIKWPRYDFEVNALGTLNVLEFARERGKLPVIYASTNKTYSEIINEIPMIEDDIRYEWIKPKCPIGEDPIFEEVLRLRGIPEYFYTDSQGHFPRSPYGCSKYAGDMYCQEYYHIYGIPTVVNRMSCIAGPWQQGVEDQGWVAWFCFAKMFDSVINIYGNGKQVRDILYVGELADLYLEQLQNISIHKGEVYNIGGGPENTSSLIEIMNHLVELDGRQFKIIYQNWRPADHRIYISSLKKISKFDWKPKVTPRETVDHIWNWANKHKKEVWQVFKEGIAK